MRSVGPWGLRSLALSLALAAQPMGGSAFSFSPLSTQIQGHTRHLLSHSAPPSHCRLPPRLRRLPIVATAGPVTDRYDPDELPSYSKVGSFNVGDKTGNIGFAILFILATFGWSCVMLPAFLVTYAYSLKFDPDRRSAVDGLVGVWGKLAVATLGYWPKVTGIENLPAKGEAVMFAPNHCSYLDILSLSGALPRNHKYVSKTEVFNFPIVGWEMSMAGHIGIARSDRKSQLRFFKETVKSFESGNSIVVFPEGTRSKTGRFGIVKGGPIKLATKSGVRIVPISICNTFKWMPSSALTPLAFPTDVEIKIHKPIETNGREEEDIRKEIQSAINSGLAQHQKSIES